MSAKHVEYEEMELKKLYRAIKMNKGGFFIVTIVFFLCSGVASLYSYSIDPVLAIVSFAFTIGILALMFLQFFFYSRLVMMLRLLAGDEDEDEPR